MDSRSASGLPEQGYRVSESGPRCEVWEVYAMIGLQVAVYPSGALDTSLGAQSSGSGTKGVMPWYEPS
jgi:hypothetical protein